MKMLTPEERLALEEKLSEDYVTLITLLTLQAKNAIEMAKLAKQQLRIEKRYCKLVDEIAALTWPKKCDLMAFPKCAVYF